MSNSNTFLNRVKFDRGFFVSAEAIIVYFFFAKILFHLLHPEYGYFRDELFFIAISDGFHFGNLDMLPLTPLYLKLITALFGYSIKSLHFASALCGAASLVLAALITRELGGKRYAVLLTECFVFFSGFLVFGALYTYDSLDFLIQTMAVFLLVKILKADNQKLWVLLGVVLGLGLLNKLSILIFGMGVFISLWLVPQREYFKRKWIWIAGIIALVFSIPFIWWQINQDWYFLDFVAGYSGGVAYVASFPEFLWGQILPNNIFGLPVWLTGLGLLLFSPKWKRYRLFGLMYMIVFVLAFFLGVKFYFLIPLYSILFAVGAIKIEDYFISRERQGAKVHFKRVALPIVYVILSMPLLPMIVPILPIDQFVKYASVLGVNAGVRHEAAETAQLPQHVADRFGWEEMVRQIASVHDSATTEFGEEIGILTDNYGQASAVHLLGKQYHLPEPVSMHGWFYFEAVKFHEFKNSYISIGLPKDVLDRVFEEVIRRGTFTNPYCMPYENNNPIYLCRTPRYDLKNFWRVSRNVDPRFLEVLREGGPDAAINYYHEFTAANPRLLLFSESRMNALGYEYLSRQKVSAAIALFKLNVEAYPEASNVYDSLGEAFMVDGQYELAVTNYKKSLELNPDNSNAREKLEEIEKLREANSI